MSYVPTSMVHRAAAAGFAPPDRRPIYEWARTGVRFPEAGGHSKKGFFVIETAPHLREPLNAIHDDSVRIVHLRKGVQSLGSVAGDVTVAHLICNRPQDFYWNFPTDKQAEAYAKRRALKFLRACPDVGSRIKKVETINRHDVCKTEVHLGNMFFAIQAANETNLQSHSVPFLINEELWQWRPSMYQHAVARTTQYSWRSKILNISQAGELGSDEDLAYLAGTQEEWEVPCLHCDQYHPMTFSVRVAQENGKNIYAGITWDTNEKTRPHGVYNFDALKKTVRIVCPHCRKETPDELPLRLKMNALCRYRATNPNASRDQRSFHWPSWASEQVRLADMVEEFLRAKDQEKIGNPVLIREWYQKRPAHPYDPEAHRTYELAPAVTLASGPKLWAKQDFIFQLVDVQADHFWVLIQAWSKQGEDMCLWFERVPRWQDVEELQQRFGVPHHCVFIDCRHRPGEVYKQCVLHGEARPTDDGMEWSCWTAVQGDPRRSFTFTPRKGRDQGKRIRYPFSWNPGPDYIDPCLKLAHDDPDKPLLRGKLCPKFLFAKGWLDPISFDRRELLLQGKTSYMAQGKWNDEFCKHLQGEQPREFVSPLGQRVTKVVQVGPNHGLDLYRMGLMAAHIAQCIGDQAPE